MIEECLMSRWMIVFLLCLMLAVPLYAQDDTPTPYEIALQRIEDARRRNTRLLDLAFLGLTQVPPEIGQLSNLQELYLYYNQLTTLPPEIGQLNSLRRLYLDNNQLTSLPSEIGQLSNLCVLSLRDNNLRHLPTSLGNLWIQPENCYDIYAALYLDDNPLVSPPPEVVEQGAGETILYLRNLHKQAWYHTQRLIIGAAGGVGLFALLLLGFRWKQRGGRKSKRG
jgi:internalin A